MAIQAPTETSSESTDVRVLIIRGQRVMLDADLARLYGVTTKRLNEQVNRNLGRFPIDFMFTLNNQDLASLRSQIATLKTARGQHSKYSARAFTEHGAIMAASVLNSPQAIEMSIYVVRTFVRLREAFASNKLLAGKLEELEQRLDSQDDSIVEILRAIRLLMDDRVVAPATQKRPIGFVTPKER